jgi:undecaprenyl-diphosphatase
MSIIQGVAEWLPISSSGHLALLHSFFGFQSLSFDVFLHFAGILAVLFIFRKDIMKLFNFKKRENLGYLLFLLIGIIPAGLVGVLFKDQIENFFSSLFYLGIFFIISGVLIYSTKFFKAKQRTIGGFDSLFIGIFQAIAIFPGISRSGATISSGIFRGVSKEEAVKFSFFMAIPIVLGAAVLELKDLAVANIDYSLLSISFIITFLVSVFTIKLFLKIIKTDKFYLFGVYNFILGILVLIWSLK